MSLLGHEEDSDVNSETKPPLVALIPSRWQWHGEGEGDAASSSSEDQDACPGHIEPVEFPPDYVTAPVERAVSGIQARLQHTQGSQLVSFPRYGSKRDASIADEDDAPGTTTLDL
jgi:hypothetical protein